MKTKGRNFFDPLSPVRSQQEGDAKTVASAASL